MKIGLVCPYNIARGGGVQECVLALGHELRQRGHTVKIITPTPPVRYVEKPDDPNIMFIGGAAEYKSPFHVVAEISVSANPDQIHQLLDTEQFDILHFHEPWVPILSRQLLTRSKAINVATFHAKLPETLMSRTIERAITPYTRSVLKYLDSLTAVSSAASDFVQSLSQQPIHIIPNGIDLKKYRRRREPETAHKTILYVGRLEKRKGVKYLLQAYHKLAKNRRDVNLTIAGDGPDREKLEALVHDKHIPRVTFKGWVSDDEKLQLLSRAWLFCSPALYGESFGIVLLEAMAVGVPVIAGNNAGYETVMRDRGTLSLVNPKDTTEFARRLTLMLDDEDLRRMWCTWAHTYIKQFDYQHVVNQYEDLYTKLYRQATAKTT